MMTCPFKNIIISRLTPGNNKNKSVQKSASLGRFKKSLEKTKSKSALQK